jgi:hypothetical protein
LGRGDLPDSEPRTTLDENLVMTIRGDSKWIAKTLNQRKTAKLRALAMWSESGERLPYNPQWAVELSDNTHNATSSLPNFGDHSPLGSGEWIVPWNVRWSVPTSRWVLFALQRRFGPATIYSK